MKIANIINLATEKIFEQSTGISQREISRIVRKAILLSFEEALKAQDTVMMIRAFLLEEGGVGDGQE